MRWARATATYSWSGRLFRASGSLSGEHSWRHRGLAFNQLGKREQLLRFSDAGVAGLDQLFGDAKFTPKPAQVFFSHRDDATGRDKRFANVRLRRHGIFLQQLTPTDPT